MTDSAAHVLEQVLTINVTDFNYTPTDILLSGSTVAEGAINAYFNPSQSPGVGFGYDIAASGDRFLAGMNAPPTSGQAGKVSVYSRTTGQVTQTLVSPTPQVGQLFGEKVDLDGDLAVVSARLATGGGAVHLFDVSTGTLLRSLASPLPASTGFGDSVAISGNLIAVGGGAGNGYRVFLFDATDGSLIETLLSPNTAGGTGFGTGLRISGISIAIGQYVGSVGGVSAGTAYVYQFDPGTEDVTLLSTLNNPSPNASDCFGFRLALSGNTVVVGAVNDDTDGADSGRAYVFNATTGTLLRTISNPTPANADFFGIGIEISGNRVAISANSDDTGASNAGAMYLFDLNSGDLLTTIQSPVPNDNDFFGGAVAFSGSSILVGVGSDDTIGLNAGAVYRYDLPVAEVVGQLTAVEPESTESFTWQLTDNAGGRFGLDGTNLVVADPTLLNFEDASSHDVVVQVTDSGGLQYSMTFTIQVTDVAENVLLLNGTSGDEHFLVLYSSTDINSGTVTVQVSTNGGPVTTIGTFPRNQPLLINGLAGTDSVLVLGTSGNDIVSFATAKNWIINSSTLILSDFETRSIGGGGGNDQYFFDADTPLGAIILVENAVVGVDRIDFSPTTTVAVSVNMSLNGPQAIHPTNLSLHLGVLNTIENLIDGSMNDVLIGNTLANTITGGPGNDAITGAGGNDSLYGGEGDDTFVFNAVTSAEADYVAEYFNQGTDTITFASMPINVNMSLTTVAVQTVHVDRTVQLNSAITFENLIGGAGNDSLQGNDLNNALTGGPGNDQLLGGGGSDVLSGGLGSDSCTIVNAPSFETDSIIELDNQGTSDSVRFLTVGTNVTLNLGLVVVQPIHLNRTLQLSSGNAIEGVYGGPGNDVLTGNGLGNQMHGFGGNDILDGRVGNDSLHGGLGNDTYAFTPATVAELDYVAEMPNEGTDTVDFSAITTPVTYDATISQQQNVHLNRSFVAQLFAVAIENVIGGSGIDNLTGNTFANTITGGPGNDTLTGADGNDLLYGGAGDDTFVFNAVTTAETDFVAEYFNQGTDTITFASLAIGVDFSLSTIAAQAVHTGRTLSLASAVTVENLTGGSGDDVLRDNTLPNYLVGNDGDDVLVGREANDILEGGAGRDILIGGLGSDTLSGGDEDDILVAGHTLSDVIIAQLIDLQTEWVSANTYSTRITNLRAGVGASLASLQAGINVLDDSAAIDTLTGDAGTDWYLRALDDVITDLFAGETIDLL